MPAEFLTDGLVEIIVGQDRNVQVDVAVLVLDDRGAEYRKAAVVQVHGTDVPREGPVEKGGINLRDAV